MEISLFCNLELYSFLSIESTENITHFSISNLTQLCKNKNEPVRFLLVLVLRQFYLVLVLRLVASSNTWSSLWSVPAVTETNERHLSWRQRCDDGFNQSRSRPMPLRTEWSNQRAGRSYRQHVNANPRLQRRVLRVFSSQRRCISRQQDIVCSLSAFHEWTEKKDLPLFCYPVRVPSPFTVYWRLLSGCPSVVGM